MLPLTPTCWLQYCSQSNLQNVQVEHETSRISFLPDFTAPPTCNATVATLKIGLRIKFCLKKRKQKEDKKSFRLALSVVKRLRGSVEKGFWLRATLSRRRRQRERRRKKIRRRAGKVMLRSGAIWGSVQMKISFGQLKEISRDEKMEQCGWVRVRGREG